MFDQLYQDAELAQFYDLEHGWSDDKRYCIEFARDVKSIMDIGCGTGLLAAELAKGRRVCGVDPARAMLDVARKRPGGARACWVEGDARMVRLDARFDLIVLTGHAFQVFLTDDDQRAVCRTIAEHLAPDGRFIFDSRNPVCEEWREWTPEQSRRQFTHPDLGLIDAWNDVQFDETRGIVTYGTFYRSPSQGRVWSAKSSIRYSPQEAIAARLSEAGLKADLWLGDWKGNAFSAGARELIPVGKRTAS